MKMNSLFLIAVVMILLGVISQHVIAAEFVDGIAKLSGNLTDGTPVTVELRTTKPSPDYFYKNSFRWGGDRDVIPKTVMTEVAVRIGDEKIRVPLSAYIDLA